MANLFQLLGHIRNLKLKNEKRGNGFNAINERLVGNEQKLVFTIQKFPQMVGVKAKRKVVNAREKKVTPFVST